MLTEQLESTKTQILNELTDKGLKDFFCINFLNHIEPNSTMMAYCHKCKEVDKIDFPQFDGNIMMHCNNCDCDLMNLETELYSFVHFNMIKKKGEQFDGKN